MSEDGEVMEAEDRAGLVGALKDKLRSLAGKHSDVTKKLSEKARKRVEALIKLEREHNELEAKFFKERATLEAKYQKLYEPIYTKRHEIVNTLVEVEADTTETNENPAENKTEEKGVPDLWLSAMKTNELLALEIQKFDEAVLKFLKNIKWSRIEEPKGFKLEFFFDTNPFFKNLVLTKTYHMIDEDDPVLEKAIGTKIEWHPKTPGKGSNTTKHITKTEKRDSFFNFFNSPQVPEDNDEAVAEEILGRMEQDNDIGSMGWLNGEASEHDDLAGLFGQVQEAADNYKEEKCY